MLEQKIKGTSVEFISSKLMERTWRRVGAYDRRQIRKLEKSHRKLQNALTLYVISAMPHFSEDANGLLLYIYHVVLEAFQGAEPRPRRVSVPQVEFWQKEVESIETWSLEEIRTSEPHVLQYVAEALAEVDDVTLTADEADGISMILWVVVECLHSACAQS